MRSENALAAREAEQAATRAETMREAERRRQSKAKAGGKPADKLIEAIRDRLDLAAELTRHGYEQKGDRYLYPGSETGIPGVHILRGSDGVERVYSHHAGDPLAACNLPSWANVKAVDAVDVVAILDFGGDFTKALHTLATRFGIGEPLQAKAAPEEPPGFGDVPPPDEEPGCNETGRSDETDQKAKPARTEWVFISPTSLAGHAIPDRKFIVDGWLPAGVVTLDFGDGGVGKTLLTQQLMTATTLSQAWCGLAVRPCRSIGLFCEDDEDELHRRQEAINRFYGCNYDDLSGMVWTSGVGQDNTLVEFDVDGRMRLTPAFHTLQQRAHELKAELVVIDTAADTFGGFENDRRQVRQFIGAALGALARSIDGAVLLNTHPSRSGMSKGGDMDGGSTAWSNTARSRWSLSRPEIADGEDEDRNARVLRKRKSNYGSTGDEIKLRWQDGVLVTIDRPSSFATMSTEANANSAFLALLARFTRENRPVSDNIRAGNYAPKLFGSCPDRQGFTAREFKSAMERLFEAKLISMQAYGRASDLRHRIAVVDAV